MRLRLCSCWGASLAGTMDLAVRLFVACHVLVKDTQEVEHEGRWNLHTGCYPRRHDHAFLVVLDQLRRGEVQRELVTRVPDREEIRVDAASEVIGDVHAEVDLRLVGHERHATSVSGLRSTPRTSSGPWGNPGAICCPMRGLA